MEEPQVRGAAVDDQTRCRHYAGPLDVVAIRFFCCDRWYPCLTCHQESEEHAISRWPLERRAELALLCGVCRRRFSIEEYLLADACAQCSAPFNPGCAAHHQFYFET
ncbi:CHY zinc finger protein [Nesterenkonia halotolerans]|uniref:CHY-type Zn-finger protein n=1 Tax=Nesterenkonia halotolerans TaxID=225325 RepID=A0ABR9J4M5_9MICC|nr:CHY zinc finger protein [Nesterenkonia halotolerans]MBE1513924.1 putative CHY-type Zn-finger protein [Nesterenkonia halotolerans]